MKTDTMKGANFLIYRKADKTLSTDVQLKGDNWQEDELMALAVHALKMVNIASGDKAVEEVIERYNQIKNEGN